MTQATVLEKQEVNKCGCIVMLPALCSQNSFGTKLEWI